MSNNKDFKVKNGIKPTVYHEAVGTVVSGSVGYSLSGASYDSKSFSVAAQDNVPLGVFMKEDGTRMFVLGNTNDTIYQYSLSTAYDVTTASYDSKSFSVTTQEINPLNFTMSTDGTKAYVLGNNQDKIFQYDLSTAWDISTASYSSKSLSVASESSTTPYGVWFNNNGTKVYMVSSTTDAVFQYSLSTAWDISTGSYDSKSMSTSAEMGAPASGSFNDDGTVLFVLDSPSVFQYNLTTAYDVSTGSYSGISFDVSPQGANAQGISFANAGKKLYIANYDLTTNPEIDQYSTVLTTASLDLSTGNVFDYTPTSDIQVSLTNPATSGTSSGATLLLGSEDAAGVTGKFSTTTYSGNGSTQTITNGIDLAGNGGLVWIKSRTSTFDHGLFDTERGATKFLRSNAQTSDTTAATSLTSFNSDGFDLGSYILHNGSGYDFVSWTFQKSPKLLDIVTYSGNGVTGREISHNLGETVGLLLIKNYAGGSEDWAVWHRSLLDTQYLLLNTTNAALSSSTVFNDTAPTSTHFTVGTAAATNQSGNSYVAYLFAHDTDASSIIKCGSYTGNGSTTGPVVDLGFEPQWVMVKSASITADWTMYDNVRGVEAGTAGSKYLHPNKTDAEATRGFNFLSNGFQSRNTGTDSNSNGATYIYMAIRNPFVPTITYDPDLQWSGGTAPTSPAIGETDVLTFNTTDGGTTYQAVQAINGAK